jgi:bifunctional UDP-N-acetylglucosamine pyrophosphorylase/glucosamine-1-phosphate N-acetyltransferase
MAQAKTSVRIRRPAEPRFAILIMAAGKGTRLKSRFPKVLHQIGGQALLEYVIAAARQVLPAGDIFAVIGHEADMVRQAVGATGVQFVLQAEQLGTGHAVMAGRDALRGYDHVLVLSGDVPLLRPETIARLRNFHLARAAAMTILSAEFRDSTGYGRIVRKKKAGRETDEVAAIVEQKRLTPQQARLREANSGIYAFATGPLFAHIEKLRTDNPHREYYLTDMAAVLGKVEGANTRAELARLDAELRDRKCAELMAAGVTIFRPETCVIDAQVTVGPDTVIEPFVQLLGQTRIGAECRVRSYSVLTSCELEDGVTVRHGCIMTESRLARGALIGPFSHLRPGSDIGPDAHVGNFVETKKAKLGRGAKANHLTYLGDAIIGANVNVGAGTITCNYDGVHKHVTTIEDGRSPSAAMRMLVPAPASPTPCRKTLWPWPAAARSTKKAGPNRAASKSPKAAASSQFRQSAMFFPVPPSLLQAANPRPKW